MFAVVETGGKQHKVVANEIIKVEKLEGKAGDTVKLDNVLAINDGKTTKLATDLKDAVISAEILEQKKDTKVLIFKKKRRQNYRRKKGHRQEVTIIRIMDVSGKGAVVKAPAKKAATPKTEAKTAEKKEAPKKAEAKTAEKKEAPKKAEAKTAEKKAAPKKAEAKPAAKKETKAKAETAKKADAKPVTKKTTTKKDETK